MSTSFMSSRCIYVISAWALPPRFTGESPRQTSAERANSSMILTVLLVFYGVVLILEGVNGLRA